MSKLDDATATNCASQLMGALEALRDNRGWSNGDLIAVTMLAATEMIARAVGPVRAAEYFRGHGDGIAQEHVRRSTC